MLKLIRSKIKQRGTIAKFAADAGIRQATLSDFINGKIDVKLSTLHKIIDPLDMSISENAPDKLIEVQSVIHNNRKYKKGDKYKGKLILLCFGSSSTTHQAVIVGSLNDAELITL